MRLEAETGMHTESVASAPERNLKHEPLYDAESCTGTTIEVFYADRMLTGMRGAGWHWWKTRPGVVPEWPPHGPFASSYRAYRDALDVHLP
jgi:hypothetical protein